MGLLVDMFSLGLALTRDEGPAEPDEEPIKRLGRSVAEILTAARGLPNNRCTVWMTADEFSRFYNIFTRQIRPEGGISMHTLYGHPISVT